MTSVQMRSFFIPENGMDSPVSTLFTTHCPRRIVIGLVDSASFNGNYTKSPFNFKHFDLTNIYIDYNGHTLPHRPLALDYEKGRYIDPYLQFLEGLGLSRSERRNGITLDMFENGWNFYVFEISTTARSPGVFDPVQQSNVTCRMEFKKPVPRGGIYAIALAEFDTILSLDSQRNPSFDSIK